MIESKQECEEQSFHCDSPEPGASGLTPMEEDQSVDILKGGFKAMVILEELRPDRKKATDLVRSRLADSSLPCEPASAAEKVLGRGGRGGEGLRERGAAIEGRGRWPGGGLLSKGGGSAGS